MVHIKLDSLPTPLRLGMTAEAEIITQTRTQTLAVPLLAASTRPRPNPTSKADSLQDVLFLYDEGKIRQCSVQFGINNRSHMEVLQGIAEGETVVSGPYNTISRDLKDGMSVEVVTKATDTSASG